jgi:hypothetical protein
VTAVLLGLAQGVSFYRRLHVSQVGERRLLLSSSSSSSS